MELFFSLRSECAYVFEFGRCNWATGYVTLLHLIAPSSQRLLLAERVRTIHPRHSLILSIAVLARSCHVSDLSRFPQQQPLRHSLTFSVLFCM